MFSIQAWIDKIPIENGAWLEASERNTFAKTRTNSP